MFALDLACVGALKESYYKSACGEYEKRLGRWCRVNTLQAAEERLPSAPSPAQIAGALDAEAERLLARVPQRSYVFALCVEGKPLTSEAFAQRLSRLMVEGRSGAAFLIGSSFGLSPKAKERADFLFSLSQMTFPHELARVMLFEQLYRAFSILGGGKYNK